ncbi:MAG: hypothetical protein ACI9FN_001047 [Saprospiraceae bacterium]|jgi:hypothetical protein
MQNRFFILVFMTFLLGGGLFLTSCSDDLDSSQEEVIGNFIDASIDGIDRKCRTGHRGCFEFVFPITVTFADETTASPESYEDLRDAVKAWKESNPDATERPDISFPIEITTGDGEVVSLADADELKEIAKECKITMRQGRRAFRNCFHLVFPVSIEFADESVLTAETKVALKTALRAWKAANPDGGERPTLVYPITIEYEDETTEEVASKEDLQAIKEACREAATTE